MLTQSRVFSYGLKIENHVNVVETKQNYYCLELIDRMKY